MPTIVENIPSSTECCYRGDVLITGSIGFNATLRVLDGSIVVHGDVGQGSVVTTYPTGIPDPDNFPIDFEETEHFKKYIHSESLPNYSIKLHGNLKLHARLLTITGHISVEGLIEYDSKLKTYCGDVEAKNVESGVWISTERGNITVDNIGARATIHTENGEVRCKNVGSVTSLFAGGGGNIYAGIVDSKAYLQTTEGEIHIEPSSSLPSFDGFSRVYVGGVLTSPRLLRSSLASIGLFRSAPVDRSEITLDLKNYLASFATRVESYSDAFARLGIETSQFDLVCPITMDVPNIPVRVDGVLYDYPALMNIPVTEDGARLNPMSRRTFYADQIQADRVANGRVREKIADPSKLTIVGMGK